MFLLFWVPHHKGMKLFPWAESNPPISPWLLSAHASACTPISSEGTSLKHTGQDRQFFWGEGTALTVLGGAKHTMHTAACSSISFAGKNIAQRGHSTRERSTLAGDNDLADAALCAWAGLGFFAGEELSMDGKSSNSSSWSIWLEKPTPSRVILCFLLLRVLLLLGVAHDRVSLDGSGGSLSTTTGFVGLDGRYTLSRSTLCCFPVLLLLYFVVLAALGRCEPLSLPLLFVCGAVHETVGEHGKEFFLLFVAFDGDFCFVLQRKLLTDQRCKVWNNLKKSSDN